MGRRNDDDPHKRVNKRLLYEPAYEVRHLWMPMSSRHRARTMGKGGKLRRGGGGGTMTGIIDHPLLTDIDPTPLVLACTGLAWWVVWRLCKERARWRGTRLTGEMLDRAERTWTEKQQ